jgi:hypothetical protein
MDDQTNVVTIRLEGADLELLRAGKAQGEADGIRSTVEAVKNAMQAWKVEALKIAPTRADEIGVFVASYDPMFEELLTKAGVRALNGQHDMARAVAAGAGKPRTASLRQRASAVMMYAARKLEGS